MKCLLPALALLAVLVPAGPAAQAGPSCPMVTDPRGDASSFANPTLDGGITRPGDDVLEADVWSDAKAVHVLVSLSGLPEQPAGGWEAEVQGFWWMVTIDRGDREVMLELLERHGDYSANAGWAVLENVEAGQVSEPRERNYTMVGGASYRVDRSRNQIRIDVPMSLFPREVGLARGAVFDTPTVTAMVLTSAEAPNVEPGGLGVSRDVASSSRTVAIGSRACAH